MPPEPPPRPAPPRLVPGPVAVARAPTHPVRALALSVGAHAVLGIVLVWATTHDLRRRVPTAPVTTETAAYLDVGSWPDPTRSARASAAAGATPRSPEPTGAPRSGDPTPATFDATDARPGVVADAGPDHEPPVGPPGTDATTPVLRLRPVAGDPRLRVAPRPVADAAPNDAERHLAAFHAALRSVRDSLQDHVDRERRVNNWSWTDPDGRAWGIRDGLLFIGGKPAFYVELHGARDIELTRRAAARQAAEIHRQAERIERERHLAERSRAMRARRDAERATDTGAAPAGQPTAADVEASP
jgi:hypothetical protein